MTEGYNRQEEPVYGTEFYSIQDWQERAGFVYFGGKAFQELSANISIAFFCYTQFCHIYKSKCI